jgi:terminase small subunit-like protein
LKDYSHEHLALVFTRENSDLPDHGEHPLTAPAYSMRRAEMAKEIGLGGEEIIEIADDLKGDYRQGRDGKAVHNKESVLRSKLRIEARQWAMARLDPRLWGDRQQIDFKADWMQLSEEERVRKAMNLLGMAREVVEREKQMKLRGPRVITYDPQDGDELAEQELRERREREMAEEQEAGGIGRDSAGNPRPRWR